MDTRIIIIGISIIAAMIFWKIILLGCLVYAGFAYRKEISQAITKIKSYLQ